MEVNGVFIDASPPNAMCQGFTDVTKYSTFGSLSNWNLN